MTDIFSELANLLKTIDVNVNYISFPNQVRFSNLSNLRHVQVDKKFLVDEAPLLKRCKDSLLEFVLKDNTCTPQHREDARLIIEDIRKRGI